MLILGKALDYIKSLDDNSIDHFITDSPFAIGFDKVNATYNRKKDMIIEGYIEWSLKDYFYNWKNIFYELPRILKPNANVLIFSSWNNLIYLFQALNDTQSYYNFKQQHQIIWKYQFGVHTKNIITSHYNIIWFRNLKDLPTKFHDKPIFNQFARFNKSEKDEKGRKLHYLDRESVWIINREYKPNQIRYKTELPTELTDKLIQYFTRENDIILDPFAGSGRIAQSCQKFNRRHISIELNQNVIPYALKNIYGHDANGFYIPPEYPNFYMLNNNREKSLLKLAFNENKLKELNYRDKSICIWKV